MVNPNFDELMADLRLLHADWAGKAQTDQDIANKNAGGDRELDYHKNASRASTRRMDMEDIERLLEKYGEPMRPELKIVQ